MKLYHNFVVDNDDDWDDNLFVVDDNSKKRKRVDEWNRNELTGILIMLFTQRDE